MVGKADISALREFVMVGKAGISALREFVMVGKAGFSALCGERIKTFITSF